MAGSFSFDTPEEVMHVLVSVRASGVDAAHKNQIRDLVLSYTNGGKDPSIQIQIEQLLTRLDITPAVAKTKLSPKPELGFGSSRAVPMFVSSRPPTAPIAVATEPAPTPVPADPIPITPAAAPIAQSVPVQTTSQTPPPAVPAEATPAAPVSSADMPTEVSPVSPVSSQPDPLQRIRQIKSLVNEKVGNPVNLVDIDNTVGREYMSSLLEAMKKVNTGGDARTEMARLESAYELVEILLQGQAAVAASNAKTTKIAQKKTEVDTVQTIAQPAAVSTPPKPTVEKQPPAPKTVDDSSNRWENSETNFENSLPEIKPAPPKPKVEISGDQVRPVINPVTLDTRKPVVPEPAPARPSQRTAVPDVPPTPPSLPARPNETASARVATIASATTAPAVDLAPTPAPKNSTSTPAIPARPVVAATSLSKTGEPLKAVTDLPTADALATSQNRDPLFTKEVDNGLNQLLSSWVLFEKSGLFGRGPKGSEHPLYVKVKELQIPILLAGRFDGATQEIKQSITDYMNGWRYEQGIIYEKGETFDHYLRRVIRHILDLQK